MKGVSLGIFAFVAIVMSITYFSAGIIYAEADGLGQDNRLYSDSPVATFEQWIGIQWKMAKYDFYQNMDIEGSSYVGAVQVAHITRDKFTVDTILNNNKVVFYSNGGYTEKCIFDLYNSGLDWYDNFPLLQNRLSPIIIFTSTVQETIKSHYYSYLEAYGIIVPENVKGFIDTALAFLGALPEAFGNIVRLFTFSIPHMPAVVQNILRIIFVPLWIIFSINLAVVVSDFLKGIGALIPF